MPHHFLVLGATALQAHHNLTIYARSPEKLPQHIQTLALTKDASPKVHIIKGSFDASSTQALTQAIRTGAMVLVSFAGPAIPAKGTPITEFYEHVLYPLILKDSETQLGRIFVLSTPSFKVPEDKTSWKWWLGVQFVYWLFGDAYQEVNGIGRVTTTMLGEQRFEWTISRVPGLTMAKAGAVRAGWVGEKGDGLLLSRRGLAIWVLQEVDERRWVGKCPAVSDAESWI